MQIAFIGLCTIQPLILPMTNMFPINFVNSALQGTATNNSLLLLLLPRVVSLGLYIAGKTRQNIELNFVNGQCYLSLAMA
jgi:hypothetical protein